MKMRFAHFRLASLTLALILPGASGAMASSYYIDEGLDYTGNGCESGDLNDVTSSLQTALGTHGWTGSRYTNASAFPQDFWESCNTAYGANGYDSSYGDARTLSVFAGHGARRSLLFANPHYSECWTDLTDNVRLGSMNGATAGFAMWLACEVLNSDDLGTNMHQSLRQQAGWENVIAIGDDEPRDFFNATNTKTNADAWLDEMADVDRRAIIATFSRTSGADCWTKHDEAKLRSGVHKTAMGGGASCTFGQPTYWYCSEERQS